MPRFVSLICAAALASLTLAAPAGAVGTRVFDLDTLDELSGGDLTGVAVGSDGVVRTGFQLGSVGIPDATTIFAALAQPDGSVLLGTSPGGKVYRVAGDQASLYADTHETAVTSLAADGRGNVYAATLPDGKIFKVSQGKAQPFATLPDTTYVWALAFDKARTNLYAAVGLPEGRVFRINPGGQAEVLFRSDEPHLVSIAVAPNGDVLAGSSGKGLLYRITGPGRATVLHDFSGDAPSKSATTEVKAIAPGRNGSLWVIANSYTEPPAIPHRSSSALRAAAGPADLSKRPKPGQGQLWRFDATGRPEKMMSHAEFHYMALALDDDGHAYVGTGAEGRVYTVNDAHAVTLLADTDERQISALSLAGLTKNPAHPGPGAFLAGSDGAVFHRILGMGGADAVWTSKPLDMGGRARFGALSFRATGPVEVSTRTGNTQTPDTTWSAWSAGAATTARVTSPAARYVQIRARLLRPTSELREIQLPFVNDNLRAVLTEVNAASRSTQHATKEGLAPSGGAIPAHDSTVHVTWKVDNPDQDALRYQLWYQREGETIWRPMLREGEVVTSTSYDWETATLPEGKYRVRVEASDEAVNPPGQGFRHTLETSDVLVDNTPPVFQTLTIRGRRLAARVVDGIGPITRLDVSYDGRGSIYEWRPLAPRDGVYDSADESFDTDLSPVVPPGPHIVAVRAFDASGNFIVREIPVR
jgi:hypothetical protein